MKQQEDKQKPVSKKPMSRKEYVAKEGYCCPYCRCEDRVVTNTEPICEGNVVTQLVSCEVCRHYWNEVFKLVGYENLSPGS